MSDSDHVDDDDDEDEDGIPMTILAVNGSFWIYEGSELLDDLLYANGSYPFPVRLAHYKDGIELRRFFGDDFQAGTLWRLNPGIIERLRRDNLLVEVYPYGK
jgi:hypothetical protein